jgi:hypothetical protein
MTDSHDDFADIPVTHLDAVVVQDEQDVIFGWSPSEVKLDVPDDAADDDDELPQT